MSKNSKKDCFVIMPIADVDGYPNGHFKHVYDNIIVPACEKVNCNPVRADEVKQTNLIHLDILKKIIESPIAICDLSTRNPNVLFELGIRQAFDKPVVLIQEKGTPKIFDITPLRYLEYSKDMKYHDVLKNQDELKLALEATMNADGKPGNVNSLIKLLALNKSAQLPDIENSKENLANNIILSEIKYLREMFENMTEHSNNFISDENINKQFYNIYIDTNELLKSNTINGEERLLRCHSILNDINDIFPKLKSEDLQLLKTLQKRVYNELNRINDTAKDSEAVNSKSM